MPILMQNRSDGDSVALGIPPPPPRDLGPRHYLPGDNSTRTPVSDGKNAMEGRPGVVVDRWLNFCAQFVLCELVDVRLPWVGGLVVRYLRHGQRIATLITDCTWDTFRLLGGGVPVELSTVYLLYGLGRTVAESPNEVATCRRVSGRSALSAFFIFWHLKLRIHTPVSVPWLFAWLL